MLSRISSPSRNQLPFHSLDTYQRETPSIEASRPPLPLEFRFNSRLRSRRIYNFRWCILFGTSQSIGRYKFTKWTLQGAHQGLPAPVNLYNPPPNIPRPLQIPLVAPIELHDHIKKQNPRVNRHPRAPSPQNLQKTPSLLSPKTQFRHVENALEAMKEIIKDRRYKP